MKTASGKTAYFLHSFVVILIPVATLLMFYSFYLFGDWAAQEDYQHQTENNFPAYPKIKVWMKPEKEEDDKKRARIKIGNP